MKEYQTSNIIRHMQLFENEKTTQMFDENLVDKVLLRMLYANNAVKNQ